MMFVQKIKHLNAKFDIISKSAILLISDGSVNNNHHAWQIRAEDFKRLRVDRKQRVSLKRKLITWSGRDVKFLQNYKEHLGKSPVTNNKKNSFWVPRDRLL